MPYQHLNVSERQVIEKLNISGHGVTSIGRILGRSHSTISRELHRNKNKGAYDAVSAQHHAKERVTQPRHAHRRNHKPLRSQVFNWLKLDWSPEIISAKLKEHYPSHLAMRVSAETIYTWVYQEAKQGGNYYKNLWRKRKKRRSHGKYKHLRWIIPNRVGIEERPAIVTERGRVGDWEGDTVHGLMGAGGIVTQVDRCSRFLVSEKMNNLRAITFKRATESALSWVPAKLLKTMTLDNGAEMADHKELQQSLGVKTYFAQPYSPWQRGSNEQVNGMIRRYFPKGTDFRKVSDQELAEVVLKINQRPRKCLNYQAPYDVFAEALRGALAV